MQAYKRETRAGPGSREPPFFEVQSIGDGDRVHNCSFGLRRGEILGIAGLVGSGRTELARLIFGADPATGGRVVMDGAPLAIASPRDAIAAGVVHLTEDRKGLGLYLDMSVRDNINTMVLAADARFGAVVDVAKSNALARSAIQSLSIRVPSEGTSVGALSGGWKSTEGAALAPFAVAARVIILDEPTGASTSAPSRRSIVMPRLPTAGRPVRLVAEPVHCHAAGFDQRGPARAHDVPHPHLGH